MTDTPLATRIRAAFHTVDSAPSSALLVRLRQRLVGELFGDADVVADTLAPDFTLVIHAGSGPVALEREAVLDAVRQQASTGTLMWIEFDMLLASDDRLAANGTMHTLTADVLNSLPIAVFIEFAGESMASEVAFMGSAAMAESVELASIPPIEALRTEFK